MERSNYCFVCGSDNPKSLHLEFKNIGKNTVITEFKLEKEYEGYPDIIHGGILAAILDDAMANTVIINNILIYTVELNVRYLKRCFVMENLQAKGWIEDVNHKIIETKGEIRSSSGELKVRAFGKYFIKNSF
jgi:acyl-coenzyme A thioesterase PaaI-like protein